jgi:hypothetical protein
MTRIRTILALSLALTACAKTPKEETRKPAATFSDNGAAASQRISASLQEPAVAAKLRNCLSQLKGEGLVGTSLTYRKSGSTWAFDDVKVTKASLPQGQDAAVQNCIQESARGTSFAVDSKEELETLAAEFVVRLGWSIPLPAEGTEVTNDAIARMIGTAGVITMEGCSTCELKTDGTGNYQCVRKTSGNNVDCEIISSNSCAYTPKACVSGFFGGRRGVVMF